MRNLCRAYIVLLALSFLCFFSLSAYAGDQYSIIDLGTLGGGLSSANDVNNSNQIVGYSKMFSSPNESIYHAFLWENGIMQDLGTLDSTSNSSANAINDYGQIVGSGSGPGFGYEPRAFFWQNGTMTDLGSLRDPYSGAKSVAYDINDHGVIAGASDVPYFSTYGGAVVWENGTI